MVDKYNRNIPPIIFLRIISRCICTMNLATSYPRHRGGDIHGMGHSYSMLIYGLKIFFHISRYCFISLLNIRYLRDKRNFIYIVLQVVNMISNTYVVISFDYVNCPALEFYSDSSQVREELVKYKKRCNEIKRS